MRRPAARHPRRPALRRSSTLRTSRSEILRAGEAALVLTGSRLLRAAWPAARWQSLLGEVCAVDPEIDLTRQPTGLDDAVRLAVARADHGLPWATNCLDRALAAQLMLRRRGACGTVVIGLRGSDGKTGERWPAHAWLVGETGTITGEGVDPGHRPVSGFRPRSPGLRRGSTR